MFKRLFVLCATLWVTAFPALSQDVLSVGTVSRAPFSMPDETGGHAGFSVELMNAIAQDLGRPVAFTRFDQFGDMLDAVTEGEVELAIANISITAEREGRMDFSQPMFAAGLQIMTQPDDGGISLFSVLFSRDLLLLIAVGLGGLWVAGLLMWVFERRAQPYFDRDARDAAFPSFWWALNLVVNGGFEERVPMTRPGRILATLMVVGSLFLVSAFVAKITTVMTVDAIERSVSGINDLRGKEIATVQGSTAAQFMTAAGFDFRGYPDFVSIAEAFEAGAVDAVVFDAPILAHYLQSGGEGDLIEPIFRRENYGIAIAPNSGLREEIDRSLLRLREDGTYADLIQTWFGSNWQR